jgi:hypothetical protein
VVELRSVYKGVQEGIGEKVWMVRWNRRIEAFRRTTLGELAWVSLVTYAVLQHGRSIWSVLQEPQAVDFAAFVESARTLLAGTPYLPGAHDPNPPHASLLFAPLVGWPLPLSLAVWLAASYVFALLTLRQISREVLRGASPLLLGTAFAAVGSLPAVLDNVQNGNQVWLLWWAFTLAWVLARRGQKFRSGLLIGCLASLKLFLGFWFVLYLVRRQWRALAGALLGDAAVTLVGVLLTGLPAWLAWLNRVRHVYWFDIPYNASIMGVLSRTGHGDTVTWAGLVVVLAGATVAAWLRYSDDLDRDWLISLLAALLISPLGWRYYLSLGVGPFLGWAVRASLRWQALLAVIAVFFCPAFDMRGATDVELGTIGSLLFWCLLTAWFVACWYAPSPRLQDGYCAHEARATRPPISC